MTKRKGSRLEGDGGRTSTSRGKLAERIEEKPRSSALPAPLHRVEPNNSLSLCPRPGTCARDSLVTGCFLERQDLFPQFSQSRHHGIQPLQRFLHAEVSLQAVRLRSKQFNPS